MRQRLVHGPKADHNNEVREEAGQEGEGLRVLELVGWIFGTEDADQYIRNVEQNGGCGC